MIDEFHVMYMYKQIQAEAATTDIKTLEQLLKKFWLDWNDGRTSTKHPDEALYCKMLQIAEKLHAVVVDEDDHKHSLPSDLMNPSWANSSPVGKKQSLWEKLISKLK